MLELVGELYRDVVSNGAHLKLIFISKKKKKRLSVKSLKSTLLAIAIQIKKPFGTYKRMAIMLLHGMFEGFARTLATGVGGIRRRIKNCRNILNRSSDMGLIMQDFVQMEETLSTHGCGDTAICMQGKLIR